MSSSPSSGLKRRRVESSGVKWIEAEFFPSAGPSRQARQAWDDDLPEQFEVVRSVGEGTFSTVWLARDRNSTSDSIYALKRVNPTCSPSRILNEYQQMRKLGGELVSDEDKSRLGVLCCISFDPGIIRVHSETGVKTSKL